MYNVYCILYIYHMGMGQKHQKNVPLVNEPKIAGKWMNTSYEVVPPSYKLVYNPINYRYITYKP